MEALNILYCGRIHEHHKISLHLGCVIYFHETWLEKKNSALQQNERKEIKKRKSDKKNKVKVSK